MQIIVKANDKNYWILKQFSILYIEKLDVCNRYYQITDFIQYIQSWNQGGIIISNYDISLLQLFLCQDIGNLKECVAAIVLLWLKKGHLSNGILQLELRINSIPYKYLSNTLYTQFMSASALLKYTVFIEEWMAVATCRNTETLYPEENSSLWLNAVT